MATGKITRIVDGKFFFIENDYYCHNSAYKNTPQIGDMVEYEPILKDGKKAAKNVKFLRKGVSQLDEYFEELESGYFKGIEKTNLKPQLIIHYPKLLAEIFQKDENKNKSSQIRKYFDSCRIIEGKYKIKRDFDFVISELLKLIPLMENSRGKKHITDEFYDFFERNVEEAVKSPNHFQKGFMAHFESIIGFYKHN
jgi:CRISPR type III-A-associated protein Csm2